MKKLKFENFKLSKTYISLFFMFFIFTRGKFFRRLPVQMVDEDYCAESDGQQQPPQSTQNSGGDAPGTGEKQKTPKLTVSSCY